MIKTSRPFETVMPGDLAYFETLQGMVKVRVLAIEPLPFARKQMKVTYQVTTDQGAYPKGHVDWTTSTWIHSRKAVSSRGKIITRTVCTVDRRAENKGDRAS
jgi:hypothetical protein